MTVINGSLVIFCLSSLNPLKAIKTQDSSGLFEIDNIERFVIINNYAKISKF